MQTCCEDNQSSYIGRIVKLIMTIIILGILLLAGYNGANSIKKENTLQASLTI